MDSPLTLFTVVERMKGVFVIQASRSISVTESLLLCCTVFVCKHVLFVYFVLWFRFKHKIRRKTVQITPRLLPVKLV